jgi:phospholipid/cholesterol/gamma-HCH transport system substrate-binding protein
MVDSGGFVEMRRTLRDASALMFDIRKVAANQDAELSKTQAALRRAVNSIDSTQIDSTLRSLKSTSASVTTFMTDLRETTAKLNTTLAKLNEGEGSAAKLMNDAALYNRVSNLTARMDSLLADFKKNPRKYIKLSIF